MSLNRTNSSQSSELSESRPNERRFWRSLDELAETDEFRAAVEREFPVDASVWEEGTSRRNFLKIMGSSLAFAGLQGCGEPPHEAIVPYVESPENIVPGSPRIFATGFTLDGITTGVLVESHEGRPTHVEGNPEHPTSLGACDIFTQARILDMYDPDRSKTLQKQRQISDWQTFLAEFRPRIEAHRQQGGQSLRILTPPVGSPTLRFQIEQLLEELPGARWHVYSPTLSQNSLEGARTAFGRPLQARYHLEDADVIAAFDCDFLDCEPARLRLIREFSQRRRVGHDGSGGMNRLFVVESTVTLTGGAADHRKPMRPAEVRRFIERLAVELGVLGGPAAVSADSSADTDLWIRVLAQELRSAGERAVVMVGESQPPAAHALCHAINAQLGAVGNTISYIEPVLPLVEPATSLIELVRAMRAGEVETLLMLDGNPAFDAPADMEFDAALAQVPFSIYAGLYENETAIKALWQIPLTHELESWGDGRAEGGTATIIQPLIRPLYNNISPHQLLSAATEAGETTAYDIVRNYWRSVWGDTSFEDLWHQSVHDGIVAESAFTTENVSLASDFSDSLREAMSGSSSSAAASGSDSLDLVMKASPTVHDGRFANNAWLQELPQPFTKLTWSNAALISRKVSEAYQLKNGDVARISSGDRSIEIPVWIVPGQPDDVVTLQFGHGRQKVGRVGHGVGVNVYPLRTTDAFWTIGGIQLAKTDAHHDLPCTQLHQLMEGRPLVRAGTLNDFQSHPEHPQFMEAEHGYDEGFAESVYPLWEYEGHKWGMSINLSTCIGCSACVLACQSENNIPVVGPTEVERGREMHWIRVDVYYSDDSHGDPAANPEVYHMPVPCMHCEHAPCEVVCPVAATTHSSEGINEMTYNRCVGTRYCSNNCPYKVRRFNFFDYQQDSHALPVLGLRQNPDVTVRSRGVMEKCTYCVQRVNAARITSKIEDRPIQDGDIQTACQSACPSQAIVFGDLNDPNSVVSAAKAHPLNYGLLADLNTRPRTTYLAAVRNPHPELANAPGGHSEGEA